MSKYRIIGCMTGNSMDAIDLVLTDFDGDKMTDVCSYSKLYTRQMQVQMEALRQQVQGKTKTEILALPDFRTIHDIYVREVAVCIHEMLIQNKIDKSSIDVIGFHGKTLDHYPPSRAAREGDLPYTLQIGSGQMLADLVSIPVIYDFRSALLMAGFEGAPLMPPHNAHIYMVDGNGCYYNGGNTSNFAWIIDGEAKIGTDAGPFNEFTDHFIQNYSGNTHDKDAIYGLDGRLEEELVQELFDEGRPFYELPIPKSGDPAYYFRDEIFTRIKEEYDTPKPGSRTFSNIVHTLEYFAAYIAAYTLTKTPKEFKLPPRFILFGGGWKNPLVRQSFEKILSGKGFILAEHQKLFAQFLKRFKQAPTVSYSEWGEFMESRLMADLARYFLEKKTWEIPEVMASGQTVICGVMARPDKHRKKYDDKVNQAAKGWQNSTNKY